MKKLTALIVSSALSLTTAAAFAAPVAAIADTTAQPAQQTKPALHPTAKKVTKTHAKHTVKKTGHRAKAAAQTDDKTAN